jgi:crossover junction endodeoxyribonuclease RusA
MTTRAITLPWPPKGLSPNDRPTRHQKAKAVRKYREAAWALTLEARIREVDPTDLHLVFTFHPPNGQARDEDNVKACMKPAQDGIADALKVDDKHFTSDGRLGPPVKGGAVRVHFASQRAHRVVLIPLCGVIS